MSFYPSRGRGARAGTSWVRGRSSSRGSASNKWKRSREDDDVTPGTVQGSSNAIHSSTREVDSASMPMVKRGSYQLVSKTKVDNQTMAIDPNNPGWERKSPTRGRKRHLGGQSSSYHAMTFKGQNMWKKASTGIVIHQTIAEDQPSATLVRRGPHQLVLKNKNKNLQGDSEKVESVSIPAVIHQQHTQESATEREKQEHGEESARRPTALKKIGSHKMVLDGRKEHNKNTTRQVITADQDIHDQTKVQNQSLSPRHSNSRDADGRSASSAKVVRPKRGQTSFDSYTKSRTMPKRIRLTTTDTTVQEVLETEGQGNNRPHAVDTKEAQERLSKFAYREIGRKGPRRHLNRTFNPEGREEPRKMGLVRANRTDNAPICPFYATGMDCTDRFCQKRHDVPIESAVPVCSFFQRNGQCLKENCRFRHIKINAQAAVCPTFALLGYCENADCTMKHIVGASQPTHSSRTIHPRKTDTQNGRVRNSKR